MLFLCSLIQGQETFTYYSYPNDSLPFEGDPPIADTIVFPHNVIIEDVNFYVGIDTYTAAGCLIISVESPTGDVVVLDNHNHLRIYLNCWFDTEEEEDGPGDLDDYVGLNAYGQWVMHIANWAGSGPPFTWDSWAIEVIGEPLTGISDDNLPLETGLNSIYPNPFNSTSVIHYSLANRADIQFDIYDVLGRLVKRYSHEDMLPGYHQLTWDGSNKSGDPVASGIYFTRLSVLKNENQHVFSKKLVLLK
jgi:hypothetical protein